MIKICLDAGHWGKYNRSPGVEAYYESDMAWKLHLLQKKFLEEYEGVAVITTRSNQETDKVLFDRGMTSKGCDLFLSDHSNAVGSAMNESVDYVAVYHLVDDNTTEIDDISKRIAERLVPIIAGVMETRQGFRVVTRKSGNDRNGDGMLNDNYYGVLHGARMAGTPGLILEHSFHTNTRMTNWLLDDGNLARLAQAEADAIAAYFGLTKKGHTDSGNVTAPAQGNTGSNEELIWNFLKSKGLNDYAVAGIWGNLKKESGFRPDNLQNTYEKKYGFSDAEYTAAVDSGAYGNFIHDSAGYGLAQWTFWSRKKALYDRARAAGASIGDLNMQLAFLWEEIQKYKQVMNVLNNAGSVQAASDAVMTGYEKPGDQSEAAKQVRRAYSQEGFDKYAGSGSASAVTFPYLVRVGIPDLNIRTGPGTDYKKTGEYTGIGTFTIVEESEGKGAEKWGLLKSGSAKRNRWISLDFVTKICF